MTRESARDGKWEPPTERAQTLLAWANRCLREDVPLDVLAAALPYDGAGEDEAMAVIDGLADAGWLIVPAPEAVR